MRTRLLSKIKIFDKKNSIFFKYEIPFVVCVYFSVFSFLYSEEPVLEVSGPCPLGCSSKRFVYYFLKRAQSGPPLEPGPLHFVEGLPPSGRPWVTAHISKTVFVTIWVTTFGLNTRASSIDIRSFYHALCIFYSPFHFAGARGRFFRSPGRGFTISSPSSSP